MQNPRTAAKNRSFSAQEIGSPLNILGSSDDTTQTSFDRPAAASLWLLQQLNDHDRVDFRLACARLTAWESVFVHSVLGRLDVHLVDKPSPSEPLICVTREALSGVAFWDVDQSPAPQSEVLGWLRAPNEVLETVRAEASVAEAREAAELREIDAIVRDWAEAGELDDKVVEVADWVEHVETIYTFIGRDVFSKSDAGSNTLARDQLLNDLRKRPPDEWRPADRLFVVAAHCLLAGGRSTRLEEFNGRQLTATGLRQSLIDRYAHYCAASGQDPDNMHALSLLELADRVRELTAEVDRSRWLRYRRVHGMTFVKNEYLADFALRDPERMPNLVAEHGWVNLGVPESGDVRADLRAMTLAAAASDAGDDGPDLADGGALGELLAAIVMSAIILTHSDYGMSSAVRDLARMRGTRPRDLDPLLTLRRADFFCCCLPHVTRMSEFVGDEDTVSILWRVAQRMMFNRWHFVPGEFDRKVIPQQRHYYYPPQLPDIAVHANYHHGGHIASKVRFSIRAPGPQAWLPPFEVFGQSFRGCYDIRLVRTQGPPYTLAELFDAERHCALVDELWRTVALGVERGTLPARPIAGFDRQWYETRRWQHLRPYALASVSQGQWSATGLVWRNVL